MRNALPLTKKQTQNLNRRFELGVYRKKTIADYPLLHSYLAEILLAAHRQVLQGGLVKSWTWFAQEALILESSTQDAVSLEFWLDKLKEYKVNDCDIYVYDYTYIEMSCVTLHVGLPANKDIFFQDIFQITMEQADCVLNIGKKGGISVISLDMRTKPPTFIRDLARDFPLGGRIERKKLRQKIKRVGEEKDETLSAPIIGFGRATVIQV